tara:strand:- start:1354 stop:1560 length:207 start_codon:yes stop_codon:yes gene_type:complete
MKTNTIEMAILILQKNIKDINNTNKKLRHLLGNEMIKYYDLLDELDKVNNIKELKELTKKLKHEATKN